MILFNTNPVLIAAAIIPAVILLVQVYRADKIEREPAGLLIMLVLYGVLSTIFALMAERLGITLLSRYVTEGSPTYNILLYFVVVGCSEEGAKYILLKRRTWYNPSFNCQFDGIVYAVFVSLGFALWENIGYVAQYGMETALLRAITAIPGHACFGVFMGTWYGMAKRYDYAGYPGRSALCRKLAFLLPAFLHGCYDFSASMEDASYAWIFYGFILFLFVVAFILVRRMSRDDRYIRRDY